MILCFSNFLSYTISHTGYYVNALIEHMFLIIITIGILDIPLAGYAPHRTHPDFLFIPTIHPLHLRYFLNIFHIPQYLTTFPFYNSTDTFFPFQQYPHDMRKKHTRCTEKCLTSLYFGHNDDRIQK